MVKVVDSDALNDVNAALGLSGAGSPLTELADGLVDQVLAINEIARRGRTQAGTSGIYTPTLRCINTGAQTQNVIVDPYNVGAGFVVAPYPDPVPIQFDVWLLGASLRRVSGSGTLSASLSLSVGTKNQGWGRDNTGSLPLVAQPIRLAYWDALVTVVSAFGLQGTLGPHARIGLRVPRDVSELKFACTSSLTSTYDCQLITGLFPIALGQDGLV